MIRRLPALSRTARRDERGAALIEFAFVFPILLMMIMAGFDAGYAVYLQSVASGALEARARSASLNGATESQFNSEIRAAMFTILPNYATDDDITLTKKNYTDYSRIDAAENITTDHNGNGVIDAPADWDSDGSMDTGDCWRDEDNNGVYGTNEGADGLGGPDDGVFYTVTLEIPRLFPLAALMGLSANQKVTARTLVINQPYGTQSERPILCRES
jgi:Flp pilus assembly protein TadG